jgi:hypothetical protein
MKLWTVTIKGPHPKSVFARPGARVDGGYQYVVLAPTKEDAMKKALAQKREGTFSAGWTVAIEEVPDDIILRPVVR